MSADNGIYILQTKDGWRVVHAQCIENLYWWYICCDNPNVVDALPDTVGYLEECCNCGRHNPKMKEREEINPKILIDYFGHCNKLDSEYAAMEEAKQLYDEIMDDDFCPIIEYGISYIKGYEDKYFPIDLIPEEYE